MAVTLTATLFGFGSYFAKGPGVPNDIDLLVIHRIVSRDSIDFAISCKKLIQSMIPAAHVVMLSDGEESELEFLRRSGAVHLAEIEDGRASEQIEALSKSFAHL